MSRTRSRVVPSPEGGHRFGYWRADKYVLSSGHWTGPYFIYGAQRPYLLTASSGVRYDLISSETMVDNASPFKGGRPFNPCTHTKLRAGRIEAGSLGIAETTVQTGNQKYLCWVDNTDKPLFLAPSDTDVLSTKSAQGVAAIDWRPLIISLANLVKGLIESKSLLGVTLKELPETIRMVRNPFGLLKKDWRKLAGSLSARDLARGGANLWLEGQYGWKSAYTDLHNFSVTAGKYAGQVQRWSGTTLRRFGKSSQVALSSPPPTTPDTDWTNLKAQLDRGDSISQSIPMARVVFDPPTVRASVSCYASDVLSRQISGLNKLLFAYGLTGESILSTIWEMIPYSFVVDWFVNVKDVISLPNFVDSVRTLSSGNISRLGYSTKVDCGFTGEILNRFCVPHYWYSLPNDVRAILQKSPPNNNGVKSHGEFSVYQRSAGMPPSGFDLWSYHGLSVTQSANGIAMLVQKILRR